MRKKQKKTPFSFQGNFLTPYDLARIRHEDSCAEYLVYNHGGQRGNLLAQIFARRIQKFFHQYKIQKNSQAQIIFVKTAQIKVNNKFIPTRNSIDHLLNQAKLCLENKRIDDRLKTNSNKFQTYLAKSTKEEETTSIKRRQNFIKSKTTMTAMNRRDDYKYLKFYFSIDFFEIKVFF